MFAHLRLRLTKKQSKVRFFATPNFDDHHERGRYFNLEFKIKQLIWNDAGSIKIKNGDQELCTSLVNFNPRLFEYIPRYLVTKPMASTVRKKYPKLLDRIDIYDKIDEPIKTFNDENNGLSPVVLSMFRNLVSNNKLLYNMVPIKYQKFIPIPQNISIYKIKNKDTEIQINDCVLELEKIKYQQELWGTNEFLEKEEKFPNFKHTRGEIIINSKHVNKKLCELLVNIYYYNIQIIPKKFITKKMIKLVMDKYPECIADMTIPNKYIKETVKSLLEKNLGLMERMNEEDRSHIEFEGFKEYIGTRPFAIYLVPEKWKMEVLQSQDSGFYTKDTLGKLYDLVMTGDFFNKYFGHIGLYEVYNRSNGKRLLDYYVEPYPDYDPWYGTGCHYAVPENSLTWDANRLAYYHKVADYYTKEIKLPANKKIKISPSIDSVIILNE